MKRRRSTDPEPPPTSEATSPPESRFRDVPRVPHDDDERPTREDRAAGHSRFEIPISLPKSLRGRHRQRD